MALKLVPLGVVTVTTAATAVPLTSTARPASTIFIQADKLNAGDIYVGDSTVDSTNGIVLEPGATLPLSGDQIRGITEGLILSDIFIDADTDGNSVRVYFLARR